MLVSVLLGAISFCFWYWLRRGFGPRVVQLAVLLVAIYLVVNGVVIGWGLWYLHQHPQLVEQWWASVHQQIQNGSERSWLGSGWPAMVLLGVALVPQLSLGFSGFELSMILMPQIRGRPDDDERHPHGRIRRTWFMLALSALLMSVYLTGAVAVVTMLIPSRAIRGFGRGGPSCARLSGAWRPAHDR